MNIVQGEPFIHCVFVKNTDTQEVYLYDNLIVSLQNSLGEEIKQYTAINGDFQYIDGIASIVVTGEETMQMFGRYYIEYAIMVNGSRVTINQKYELIVSKTGIK